MGFLVYVGRFGKPSEKGWFAKPSYKFESEVALAYASGW
jgi:hypothetical protein